MEEGFGGADAGNSGADDEDAAVRSVTGCRRR